MKYSNAIGAALNGLFKTTVAQQPQNGMMDALKIAQGESTINQNNASISKNNAEAQRLNDERLLYSDDALRGALTSALTGDNQADRTNALLRLTPLVKNPEQVTDAIGKSFRQLYADNVMNGVPNAAQRFNTLNAAEGGKLYSDVGSTGLTLNQGTGKQEIGNNSLYTANLGKIGSETGKNNAQARQAQTDVRVKLKNLEQSGKTVETDGNGNLIIVDKSTAVGQPVLLPNAPNLQESTKKTPWSTLPPKQANAMKQRVYTQAQNELAEDREYFSRAKAALNDMRRFGELNREQSSGGIIDKIPWTFDPEAQEMDAITARLAPNQRPQGSGATSDFDAKMYLRGVPSRDKSPETNKSIREYAESEYKKLSHALDFKESYLLENGFLPSRKEIEGYVEVMRLVDYMGSQNIKTQQDFDAVVNRLKKSGWSNQQILTASDKLGL